MLRIGIELAAGLGLLVLGAELLVRGASRLAAAAGISPLVIGLTVVAYGTSAPELAVSLKSGLAGQADIALGNVVGSNIFNVLAVLGLSALAAPLAISRQLVRLDVPLMILSAVAVLLAASDGRIERTEGLAFLAAGVAYTWLALHLGRRDLVAEALAEEAEHLTRPGRWTTNLAFTGGGILLLVGGAHLLVDGAVGLARAMGVGELVIGLTLVAAGTSLPELATSVVAALKGERDIAVGNVVGSNLFNVLIVLGAASAAAPGGVAVSPAALRFDIPVMIAVSVACLPIFFTGYRISRGEGLLFLCYYGAYLAYLWMKATGHAWLGGYAYLMSAFVLPVTGLVLLLLVLRSSREAEAVEAGLAAQERMR